jgi:DNA-binding IclR family transcriptional regulator
LSLHKHEALQLGSFFFAICATVLLNNSSLAEMHLLLDKAKTQQTAFFCSLGGTEVKYISMC